MRIVELEDFVRMAARTERAARLLAKFRERVSRAESAHAVAMMRPMELIAGGAAWKMKLGGNGYRLIFTLERTPRGVPFAVVHHVLSHDDYVRRDGAGEFETLDSGAIMSLPEVVEAVRELDTDPPPLPLVHRRATGLRFSLDVSGPSDAHTVNETADWVDRVLLPLVESPDQSAAWLLAAGIIDAANDSQTTFLDDTEIMRVDGATLVSRTGETAPFVLRREFPKPNGPDAIAHLVRIHQSAGAQVDPFLVLHPTQKKILERFRDRPFQSLPAVFDGPGGSGKSAVLLLLVKCILQHRIPAGEDVTVHLVTASPWLTPELQRNVSNHLQLVDGWDETAAEAVASRVCVTLDDYLLQWLDEDTRERFSDPGAKITWPRFRSWYEQRFLHDGQSHEMWCALRAVIDGDREGRDDPLSGEGAEMFDEHVRTWFSRLPDRRRQGLSDEAVSRALHVRRMYNEWKANQNLWDESDLVDAFMDALDAGGRSRRLVDLIVVDEAQDLTPDMIRGIVRTSSFFASDTKLSDESTESDVPLPFLFAADDMQTINPSGFTWTGFRTLFFEETARMLGRSGGVRISPETLNVNFRMRENVYDIALSLRRWMNADAGGSGNDAIRSVGFSGPVRDRDSPELWRVLLGRASRILIPGWDHLDHDEVALLENALGPRKENPRWGKVLTATEAKGQEFKSAVLLGFGRFVRNSCPELDRWKQTDPADGSDSLGRRFAQQITYVAASRVRDVAVWLDVDDTAEEWFWEGTDPRSPASMLKPKRVFGADVLDEMEESSSEKVRDGRIALETALRNVDLDRHDRAAAARAAAAVFGEADEFLLQRTAAAVAQYLDPRDNNESLRLIDIPEPFRGRIIDEVCSDRSWYAFDGPVDASSDGDLIGGAAVLALIREDSARAVSILNMLSGENRPRHPEIVRALDNAWRQVVEHLADLLDASPPLTLPELGPSAVSFLETLPGAETMVLRGLIEASRGDLQASLEGLARVPRGMGKVRAALNWAILSRHTGITWIHRDKFPEIAAKRSMNEEQRNQALRSATEALVGSEEFLVGASSLDPAQFALMPTGLRARVLALHLTELALSLSTSEEWPDGGAERERTG